MKSLSLWCVSIVILINSCAAAQALSPKKEPADDAPPFNVDQWLYGPDREDFSWSADIFPPILTLQQRYSVRVRASFYIRSDIVGDQTIPQDFHFVLKVAAGDGNWIPQYSYTRIPFPSKEDKYQILEFRDAVYLRPGLYTIALIAYDAISGKGNILHKRVTVSPVKRDKLPELDRDLPKVEFTSDERPLAKGREWLPVNNQRSLCIDIIANTSMDPYHHPTMGRNSTGRGPLRTGNQSTPILQVASVLSHLGLSSGRVRVSIVDTLRMQTLFHREDASGFDWKRASQIATAKPSPTIDIDLVASQTQASAYLHDRVQEILEDSGCASGTEIPLKTVIVVSTDMVFPADTLIREIALPNRDSVRFFHFKIPMGDLAYDDLHKMLKRTEAKAFTVRNGASFRKNLADLIAYLEKFAK